MKKMLLTGTLAGVLLAGLPTSLFAIIIDGKTNIFVAGQDSTGINTMGGLFPVATVITPGTTVLSFAVTGSVTCAVLPSACATPLGADGGNPLPGAGTNITPTGNGISGIQFTGREMFLVGVFLNDGLPSALPTGTTGPFSPAYVGSVYNADGPEPVTPFFLGQVFHIGDGREGFNNAAGTVQLHVVPTGATRLFLGFADAFDNFTGPWGAYGDNAGSLDVTITGIVPSAVPEPATIMLMGLGLMGLAVLRKKIA